MFMALAKVIICQQQFREQTADGRRLSDDDHNDDDDGHDDGPS